MRGLRKEKEDAEAAMRSLEAKGKETETLEELYNNLVRDWNAYKQSNPGTSRTCCADSCITVKAVQLLHNSPRHLMSQLQGITTEIAGDGRKMKGRRLFEAMEGETEKELDMSHARRSLSFCYSEDEDSGFKGQRHSSSSSSSSPFGSGEEEAKVKGGKESVCVETDGDRRSRMNGGRYIVMLGGFGIALLIFAVCVISATSYGGFEGILVPT